MRYGVITMTSGPFGRLMERFRRFEALGFDAAWVDDDLIRPGVSDYEAWTVLGAVARETSRIRIGTLVTTIAFRHPALLAGQALTVDHLSGGRLTLGLGSGACCPEFNEEVGHGPWSNAERADRFEEQVGVLDALLRGQPIDHAGPHYPTRITAPPAPSQRPRPPILLAAHGPRGLRLTAARADGWSCFGGQSIGGPERTFPEALAETRRLLDVLDAACAEAARDPASVERSVLAFAVRPDPFESLDWFDEYVGRYAELGVERIDFFWPPFYLLETEDETPPAVESMFERISTERILGR